MAPERPVTRSGLIVFVLLALSLLGMSARPSAAARAASPALGRARDVPLFTWKMPRKGAHGDWSFSAGTLQYNGASTGAIFPKFSLGHAANFAVQARIRAVGAGGPTTGDFTGFGLVVRQFVADPHTSIVAGSFFSDQVENNGPELYWDGDTVGGEAFNPGFDWHLYRLDVHGDEYTLSIDGKRMVTYTIGEFPFASAVGIFSRFYAVAVKNFSVSLTSPAPHATVYPPVKPYVLQLSDLPTDTFYLPDVRHFYTNPEFAREHKTPLATIEAGGRIVAYGVDYSGGYYGLEDVYNTVTAYGTASQAQADIGTRLAAVRTICPQIQSCQDASGGGVGEASAAIIFTFATQFGSLQTMNLYFARGKHMALVLVSMDVGTTYTTEQLQAITIALAKIVDSRLESAP